MLSETEALLRNLSGILERLGIPYLASGSVASSILGIPRFTRDLDLAIVLKESQVQTLVEELQSEYYVDAGMIQDAIRKVGSFNVLHLATMAKADLFIARPDAWGKIQMERRQKGVIGEGEDAVQVFVASAEDLVLNKLLWYKMGNEVSDRQWQDILGLLQVQGATIDREYLGLWAGNIGVLDLLERAVQQAAC